MLVFILKTMKESLYDLGRGGGGVNYLRTCNLPAMRKLIQIPITSFKFSNPLEYPLLSANSCNTQ